MTLKFYSFARLPSAPSAGIPYERRSVGVIHLRARNIIIMYRRYRCALSVISRQTRVSLCVFSRGKYGPRVYIIHHVLITEDNMPVYTQICTHFLSSSRGMHKLATEPVFASFIVLRAANYPLRYKEGRTRFELGKQRNPPYSGQL